MYNLKCPSHLVVKKRNPGRNKIKCRRKMLTMASTQKNGKFMTGPFYCKATLLITLLSNPVGKLCDMVRTRKCYLPYRCVSSAFYVIRNTQVKY